MCVIVLVDSELARPSEKMVEMMWEKNADGGGAAWQEVQENGDRLVCWEKGLMKEQGLKRLKDLVASLPIPFVFHCRIATSGGVKANMTHPFPIDQRGQNTLTGKTPGFVLFHNGTARDWEKEARSLAISSGIPIPAGKWSDSRGLAWICSILGNGYMEFLPEQKGIAFGPNPHECDIFAGTNGWDQVVDPVTGQKVWCSNSHFLVQTKSTHTGYNNGYSSHGNYEIKPYCAGPRNCLRQDSLDSRGMCPNHASWGLTPIILAPSGSEVGRNDVPFPQTPKDTEDPQGPILSLELAEKAMRQGKIGSKFLSSVKRAHERMRKGGKDGERAKRQLILCATMPLFMSVRP